MFIIKIQNNLIYYQLKEVFLQFSLAQVQTRRMLINNCGV